MLGSLTEAPSTQLIYILTVIAKWENFVRHRRQNGSGIGVALGISALIWKKIKQLLVRSEHQNTCEDTGNVVKYFLASRAKRRI